MATAPKGNKTSKVAEPEVESVDRGPQGAVIDSATAVENATIARNAERYEARVSGQSMAEVSAAEKAADAEAASKSDDAGEVVEE